MAYMNKENATKSIDIIISELNKSSFSDRFTCVVEIDYKWKGNIAFELKETNRKISCNVSHSLTKENKEEIETIQQKINEVYEADKETHYLLKDFSISNSLKKGDVFPYYKENLTDVRQEIPTEIKHQPDEVLLLDFWATWRIPCQDPMQHNQEMLENNGATWGDKVRIIGVSVDDNIKEINARIEEKKWDKIIHYTTNGWDDDNALLSNLQIQGIPFVALINKQGIIDFVGHPSKINLESRIEDLLAQPSTLVEQGDQTNITSVNPNGMSREQAKRLKNVVENQLKSFIKDSKNPKDFQIDLDITLTKEVTFTGTGKQVVYSSPSFRAVVEKKQVENYETLKNKLYSLIGEDITFKKPTEKILDIKKGLKKDIQELAGIIKKETKKSVEFEHTADILLTLRQQYNFAKYRVDNLLIASTILIEPNEDAKKSVTIATNKCRNYISQKQQRGEYADYMFKQQKRGIRYVEKEEDILPPVPRVNEAVYRKVKEILEDKSLLKDKYEKTFKYCPYLRVLLRRHRVFDSEGNMKEKFYEQPRITFEVKDVDLESFSKNVTEKIMDRIGRDLFVVKGKIIKTDSIPLGTNCKFCGAELSFPYYYNPFQKEHYCLPCGNKRDEIKKTIDSFNVPHNLVFIPSANPEYLTGIESYKFGKDIQPDPEKEMQFEYEFGCNSCQYGSDVCRYICLNCLPGKLEESGFFDLCHKCFDKSVIQKDEEFNQNLKEENNEHNENHLLFKIITSEGGYRNF